jgi:type II secretory pathway component PulF
MAASVWHTAQYLRTSAFCSAGGMAAQTGLNMAAKQSVNQMRITLSQLD